MAEGNPAIAAENASEETQQQQLAKEEGNKEEKAADATPAAKEGAEETASASTGEAKEAKQQSSGAEGEHKLQSLWTIWFNDISKSKPSAQPPDEKGLSVQEYEKRLQKVGQFDTIEGFWAHYRYLVRPSQLNKLTTLSIFRNETKPTWENYEEGGHWLVTIAKRGDNNHWLDRLWEQLIFALIGEEFEEPLVVGIVVQVRIKEDVLSVWLGDKAPKFRVGEKLKQILHLQPSTVIEYKNNKSSLKDASGLRNAQAYYVGEDKKSAEAAAAVAVAQANNAAPVPGQA